MQKLKHKSDIELFMELSGSHFNAEVAFAELYSRHAQRVFAYCLRIMGNNEDAQDIFQETFIKFHKSAQVNESMENIGAYLITTARNLCLNYKRGQKRDLSFEEYSFVMSDDGFEQQEMLELIAAALELLDFEHREAFVLRNYQGLSYKEIAKITHSSLSAIKNRVWRAKEKIREALVPYLEDMSN